MAARERIRLTDAFIARLRPRDREYSVWDTRVAGLGVRVRPSGGASFVRLTKVEGRSRRVALGPVTSRAVEEVRRHCHTLMAGEACEGTAKLPTKAPLFRDFIAGQWSELHYAKYKSSTRKGVRWSLDRQLLPAFGSTPLDRITRAQVLNWFNPYSQNAPGGANHSLGLLNQILNFAVSCGHIDANRASGVRMNRRLPLTRFLSREELQRLHLVLDEHSRKSPGLRQQADIIRLLLLTGCRLGEILKLKWSEVDGERLRLADTKSGPRTVHLNARARCIVERQPRRESVFMFPSPRNAGRPRGQSLRLWDSARREANIEDVRLHDLRHTFASHAIMNGVPVPVVARLLGHTNVKMTLRYAHLADKEIEAAAERVGAAIAKLTALKRIAPDSSRAGAGVGVRVLVE